MLHNQTILAKSTLAAYFLWNVIETILTSEWRIGVTASDRWGGNTKNDCLWQSAVCGQACRSDWQRYSYTWNTVWSILILSLATTNINKILGALQPLTLCSKQPLSSPPLTWRQGWSRSEQQWGYVDKLTSPWLRDGSGLQNTWIFGQVPMGGGHFQSKNLYSRFWTFNI